MFISKKPLLRIRTLLLTFVARNFREYVDLEGGWNEASEVERHTERLERQRFRLIVADG